MNPEIPKQEELVESLKQARQGIEQAIAIWKRVTHDKGATPNLEASKRNLELEITREEARLFTLRVLDKRGETL